MIYGVGHKCCPWRMDLDGGEKVGPLKGGKLSKGVVGFGLEFLKYNKLHDLKKKTHKIQKE